MRQRWTGFAVAQQQQPKVRPDVWQTVQEKGIVWVNVLLNGQWELDAKLSREAALAQRQAIAAAQRNLIAELAGTRHKVLRQSQIAASISLEVGPDALRMLENSDYVKDVYLERWLTPQSVPLIQGDQAWSLILMV